MVVDKDAAQDANSLRKQSSAQPDSSEATDGVMGGAELTELTGVLPPLRPGNGARGKVRPPESSAPSRVMGEGNESESASKLQSLFPRVNGESKKYSSRVWGVLKREKSSGRVCPKGE